MIKYLNSSKSIRNILILVYPLLSLYVSLRYYYKSGAKNQFWMFCTFYGLIHIVFNSSGYYIDSMAYALDFIKISSIHTIDDFQNYISNSNKVDFYVTSLSIIISKFTSNYQILFIVLAFIFGYFYSRNIWFLLNKIDNKSDFKTYIYIAFFILLIPIWQINGRMWTAAHIFFYGAIQYLLFDNKKKLLWCLLSPIVHFSFLFPLAVIALYIFLPRKPLPYIILLIISMTASFTDLKTINYLLNNMLPSLFESKINAYANVQYARNLADSFSDYNIVVQAHQQLYTWAPKLGIILFYFTGKHIWKSNNTLKNLLCFCCLMSAFAGFTAMIPSVSRFLTVAYMFNISYIILISTENYKLGLQKNISTIIIEYIFIICLLYIMAFSIRIGFMFIGLSFFFSTPITFWFINDTTPILEYFN